MVYEGNINWYLKRLEQTWSDFTPEGTGLHIETTLDKQGYRVNRLVLQTTYQGKHIATLSPTLPARYLKAWMDGAASAANAIFIFNKH
jgi:hypothetical protein